MADMVGRTVSIGMVMATPAMLDKTGNNVALLCERRLYPVKEDSLQYK